jgi:hypothetical protein
MASRTHRNGSPTLPPTRAERIDLEHFFEVASVASLRALAAHAQQQVELNPQPEPPGVLRVPHIWVGIVASLALPENALPQAPSGIGSLNRARGGGGQE